MSWRLIIPPTGLAISMAEAQLSARADVDDEGKSPLDADIRAAVETYTLEAETETRRAIMLQTWRLTLPRFTPTIMLSYAPLQAVEHVKYYGLDGVQRILDPELYQVDAESEPGRIVPAPGQTWPATAERVNAVEVQLLCGYGADHNSVPASFKGFIRARIAEQFRTGKHAENPHVKGLLAREVVYE